MTAWNPRYTLYAKLHGLDEDRMLALDRERHPGGCMVGFSLWIQHHVRAYCDAHPERHMCSVSRRPMPGSFGSHEQFDEWLRANAKLLETQTS